jgi:hypothetical protein
MKRGQSSEEEKLGRSSQEFCKMRQKFSTDFQGMARQRRSEGLNIEGAFKTFGQSRTLGRSEMNKRKRN